MVEKKLKSRVLKIICIFLLQSVLDASILDDGTINKDKKLKDFHYIEYVYSEDYPSSGFFYHLADHAYMSEIEFHPEEVQVSDIVFIPEYSVPSFVQEQHKLIKNQYILLIHVSGMSYDGNLLKEIVSDPKVIAIFTIDATFKHPKVHPIPLGIWPHVPITIKTLDSKTKASNGLNLDLYTWENYIASLDLVRSEQHQKKHLSYLNIKVRVGERQYWYDNLKEKSFCYIPKQRLPSLDFFREIASSYFVYSPPGFAFDCFRTWEILYLGSIPIVLSSANDSLYEGLPVVIVKDVKEITEEFLISKLEEFAKKNLQSEKLTQKYWINLISSYKEFAKSAPTELKP